MSCGDSAPTNLLELLNSLQSRSRSATTTAVLRRPVQAPEEQACSETTEIPLSVTRSGDRSGNVVVDGRLPESFDTQVVLRAFERCGYPLRELGCSCSEDRLTLVGHVSSYFYLQIALKIATSFAGPRQVELQVAVKSPETSASSVDSSH